MEDMELTQEEVAIVNKYRQQKAEEARMDFFTIHCLQTALDFEVWRQRGGYGTSYSTFLNDFEYKNVEGIHQKVVYNRVCMLLKVARTGEQVVAPEQTRPA